MSETDSEDPKRLIAVTNEIEAVMRKHGVGGCVAICSPHSAAWHTVLPDWAGLVWDMANGGAMRVQFSVRKNDPAATAKADATMGMIANLRDMFTDYANFYGRIYRETKLSLESRGSGVDHVPWNGTPGIYPRGRKGG